MNSYDQIVLDDLDPLKYDETVFALSTSEMCTLNPKLGKTFTYLHSKPVVVIHNDDKSIWSKRMNEDKWKSRFFYTFIFKKLSSKIVL